MGRGRKKKPGVRRIYDVRLYLWESEDDDLIAFLEDLPEGKRSAGVKTALRNGGALAETLSADQDEDDDLDFDLDAFTF